jgi:Gon7 family
MAETNGNSPATLKAYYKSPSDVKDFTVPLSSQRLAEPTVYEKTSYLSELRARTKTIQKDINTFLTAKMEEEKAPAARETKLKQERTKEELEEENYGEEVAEDD